MFIQPIQIRPLPQLGSQRPQSYQSASSSRSELSPGARFAEAERRLFRGPAQNSVPSPDGDPRRFFPSRPTATFSTSHIDRDPEEPRGHRYSATDMHNVLARQARLEGSRLTADLQSTYRAPRGDAESVDISHDGFSTSRAHMLISRYHEQAEAEARESSSSTPPWASLPSRRTNDTIRADVVEARRRRAPTRAPLIEVEPMQFRHRSLRDQSFHAMFAPNHALHGPRFRRRALGDYMVRVLRYLCNLRLTVLAAR